MSVSSSTYKEYVVLLNRLASEVLDQQELIDLRHKMRKLWSELTDAERRQIDGV